ncbi:hypothetical protein CAEBREN_04674 [Caenorhabditis brenneri]|uniref:DUF38 domain-containing protein n=1 Tax=Caenorhabditis brenneri TaxID=135651 RepID=G0N699_CAEBE|nr:hypothetical protein CAEBREN_04674 [Caenorhabditis brenneri]
MELIELTFNDEKILYEKCRSRTRIHTQEGVKFREAQYEYLAFAKLERILMNPSLKFERVTITFGDVADYSDLVMKQCSRIENVFLSLNHQIHSESLHLSIKCAKQIAAVLPYFKPGVLREIDIYGLIVERSQFNCGQLVNMDQFKQAKVFALAGCYFTASHDHLIHFEQIEVELPPLKTDDIVKFRDAFLASKNFKSCTLVCYVDDEYDEIGEITEQLYPITGTQKRLSIYVNNNGTAVFFNKV